MSKLARIARLACLLLPLCGVFAAAQEDTTALGRTFTADFQAGRLEPVWQRMNEEMRGALGSLEDFRSFRDAVRARHGAENAVVSETSGREDGYRVYLRRATHAKGGTLMTQWTFDDAGRIAGFFIRPVPRAAESSFLDYRTKADLRLPFSGRWYVFWGGRSVDDNYHAADKGQRFAYDFVIRRAGSTHTGDGAALADYRCWDAPVLAPAAGRVARSVDGLPDQAIGARDSANPAGNHVVLDLGNGEFAFLAHLRQGSVAVETGEAVARGQEVGRCGNSGNTSEPHLHFHLQTSATLGEGEGLPAQFRNYTADGQAVARGEPQRGQTVAPQAP